MHELLVELLVAILNETYIIIQNIHKLAITIVTSDTTDHSFKELGNEIFNCLTDYHLTVRTKFETLITSQKINETDVELKLARCKNIFESTLGIVVIGRLNQRRHFLMRL